MPSLALAVATSQCDGEKTSIDGSARRALATDPPFNTYTYRIESQNLAALKTWKRRSGKSIG